MYTCPKSNDANDPKHKFPIGCTLNCKVLGEEHVCAC